MVDLNVALLVGTVTVTIKDISSAFAVFVKFDFCRIRKLAAVICKYYGKEFNEPFSAEQGVQIIENICNRLRRIGIS